MSQGQFERKDNTGALFKNEKKKTDRHPDYTGNASINGREIVLSAWIAQSKSGKTYLRFKAENKDEMQQQYRAPQHNQQQAQQIHSGYAPPQHGGVQQGQPFVQSNTQIAADDIPF